MQVRPVTGKPRPRYRFWRRLLLAVLRWSFIVIGALTASAVLLYYIYRVNEAAYDPAMFAIGVAGLFAMMCGVMLMVLSRNSRLRLELRNAKVRCEELADFTWELKEAEARAVSLLEAQGDLIVRRDGEGRITYANDAFCALAGQSRDALRGSATALTVLEQGAVSVLPDGTRMHDQKIATAEGPRWLAWREAVVFVQAGGSAEVQSVGRDVTERTETGRALGEARDAAEAASRAKSRFLAMVSHEIRTPLNGMLGMTDLLLDTPLTPEQTAYINAAKASGDALLSLIEEILDFSKIEAGKLELEVRPFAPVALVEEIVELLGPRAQAKGLEIASDVDDRLPGRVTGDATRLRQVLLNLAGNAIKFTETGGVSVVAAPGAGRDEIVFEVSDTGIGIAADAQARIFLEFEQADGSPERRFGGTGLGLAISRRIVERMGGRIDVESVPGQGSTFRVTVALPRVEGMDSPVFTAPDLGGKAALIVARQSLEASLLARRLARWGAATASADAGDAAIAIAGRRFDAVLIDHALGADAVAAAIRSVGGVVARRIVLITPSERHRLPALKAAGFTGYLVKPVRAASLAARLTGDDTFDAPGAVETSAVAPAGAPAGGNSLAILVAEDNDINALLARALLAKLGHRPTMAANGAEALAAWRAAQAGGAPFDIVLMDVQMPGVDGLEATRQIRAAEAAAGTRRTPIVALTANAFAEDRESCTAAGMDDFLVKPLDRDRLAAMLAELPGRAAIAA
jgi:PAS domain S-box-containing protein